MQVLAFGDIIINTICTSADDQLYTSIQSDLLAQLDTADIVFGNLETPLTTAAEQQTTHYSKMVEAKRVYVKSIPQCAEFLSKIGFNIVSLANNHILDYKSQGFIETTQALDAAHIYHIGAGKNIIQARMPQMIEKQGIKTGFLAYSYTYEATRASAGCAPLRFNLIKEDITNLKKLCDNIIISIHFGEEYTDFPSNKEINFCHALIDLGASVVLVHHAHYLRPIECYHGGLIAYGLGNFIIDYSHFIPENLTKATIEQCRDSMTLQLDFDETGLYDWKVHPLYLNASGFPVIPPVKTERRILQKIQIYNEDQNIKKGIPLQKSNNSTGKKFQIFLKLFCQSLYHRNLTNIYLLLKRLVHGG